jgi:hypothetical protein
MAKFMPPGLQYALDKRICGPQNRYGRCEREKNLLPLPGSETQFFSHSVRNLVANLLSYFVSNRFTFTHVSAYFHSAENASTSLYKYTILLFVGGERPSPLCTPASSGPILPAQDDDDDDRP